MRDSVTGCDASCAGLCVIIWVLVMPNKVLAVWCRQKYYHQYITLSTRWKAAMCAQLRMITHMYGKYIYIIFFFQMVHMPGREYIYVKFYYTIITKCRYGEVKVPTKIRTHILLNWNRMEYKEIKSDSWLDSDLKYYSPLRFAISLNWVWVRLVTYVVFKNTLKCNVGVIFTNWKQQSFCRLNIIMGIQFWKDLFEFKLIIQFKYI